MSGSTGTIDTYWEKVSYQKIEEIVSTYRNIGLYVGEASPQELGAMIMDPATRNLQKVEIDDVGLFDKVINNLMGKSSIPKKEFVFNRAVKEVL